MVLPVPLDEHVQGHEHVRVEQSRLAAVVVEHPAVERWARLRPLAPVQILDAGFTVVAPGTCTALARWA